ncbi:hypothetical protein VTO73DRAFT_9424 [Trametes versicolor]
MADAEQDGPDLETLQAQIDMSMAFTHNIVSGWMKSSKTKLPSSSSRTNDKDLEEYMRKPARLGVGAAPPEATGVLGRETAKLRNKLTGKGKKRERDEAEEGSARTGAQTAGGGTAESDEDEDSRARAITKKVRVDPFAARGDGKKKKKKKDPVAGPATAGSTPKGQTAEPLAGEDVEMGEAEADQAAAAGGAKSPENDAALPALSKKKRKKKHKAGAGHEGAQQPGNPQAQHNTAGSPVPVNKNVASDLEPTEASASSKSHTASAKKSLREPQTDAEHALPSAQSTTPVKAAEPAVRQDLLVGPLLNLSGPPPIHDTQDVGSPKKKRKRKKKKKKTVGQPAADMDAVHEDGEAEGSDDD